MKLDQIGLSLFVIGIVAIICGCSGSQVAQPTPQIIYVTVTPSPTPQIIYVTVTPQPSQGATEAPTQSPTAQPTTQTIATQPPAASTPTPSPTPFNLPIGRQLVNVTAVNLHINYKSPYDYYFGLASQTMAGFTANGGSSKSYSITFKNNQAMNTVFIDSITTNTSGFSLTSVSPTVPSTFIGAGDSITETLTIQVPDLSFKGTLDIYVKTHHE